MDKLTPFIRTFGLVILATVAVLLAFFVIGIERRCTFEIRNGSKTDILLRTYRYDSDAKTVAVDSVVLAYDETFEIGRCVKCATADSSYFEFDAIAVYDSARHLRFMRRGALLKFLESKEREGCGTYVLP